jgi:hypothetical protein
MTPRRGGNNKLSTPKRCLMIFGRSNTYGSRTRHKLTLCDVYGLHLAMPQYLKWSETTITFDRSDMFPLIVDSVMGNLRLFKVLMYGSNGLNILYVDMLDIVKVLRYEI